MINCNKVNVKADYICLRYPSKFYLRCNDTPRLNPLPIIIFFPLNHLQHNLNT